MYLTEANLWDVVKKQYSYKLKAYMGLFFSLLAVQVAALLMSLGSVGGSGTGTGDLFVSVRFYSGDIIILFTLLWAFITGITLTTKEYRHTDFSFITNRISSNLSSIGFLLTLCIAGGVLAILSSILLRVIVYFFIGSTDVTSQYGIQEILIGMIATASYLILISAVGYFTGMLVQFNKIFIVLLPALYFGTFITNVRIYGNDSFIIKTIEFFNTESSLALFSIKVIIAAIILFGSAVLLSNRMEVRK